MTKSQKAIIAAAGLFAILGAVPTKGFSANHKEMVTVPAGEFRMGCKDSDGVFCVPGANAHTVYLKEYKIDKYMVTFDRYQECIDAGYCSEPYYGAACNYQMSWAGDHPVNCITYEQAEQVCSYEGKRLPTEAEWAKAARGTDGRIYPWGNSPKSSCDLAVMNQKRGGKMGPGCGAGTTQPVGSKPKGVSPYGAMDMVGNLWEWTSDWYDDLPTSAQKNPKGPRWGDYKVLRGSSWTSRYQDELALTVRFPYAPKGQGYVIGARCAAD
ncbi:formylglycine-generating enzyme family protein [Ruegeria sp. Ofav3-42]|uniref:formylglycine-generating enzyme family protein n=1 Tax=Ruegeria sp. Ofav3-42 TaxID=2917759 RepID=UPI001EF58F82|nr:formylglycine-generating enzyme family protein [Ruegeria sp. Ofav3-42]MCG7522049.1 formylglycine-generating enzyme family protein [Ruegeria sp. Ofav3-42]